MRVHRLTFAVLCGILVLTLTACSPIVPGPSAPATAPVSPLATLVATAQHESAPSAPASPLAPPTTVSLKIVATPAAGKTVLAGRLIDFKTSQPMANQSLSLPSIICPEGVSEAEKREQCVYLIDDAFDPSVLTDQEGRFAFQDLRPGDYVLLVGNRMTEYVVLADDFDRPLIWKAEADKLLQLGDLVVELP